LTTDVPARLVVCAPRRFADRGVSFLFFSGSNQEIPHGGGVEAIKASAMGAKMRARDAADVIGSSVPISKTGSYLICRA
jgi:hypothetical protein